MKIGIISDIHAYINPLKEALAIFDAHKVDKIICAGDLVEGGSEGDAVVKLIRDLKIDTVMGNHDRDVFTEQAWVRRNIRESGETSNPLLLELETVAFVSSLRLNLTFSWENHKICLAHGIPYNNTRYLFPNSSEEQFDEALEQTTADILILGHTHQPMIVQKGHRYILNAGSVAFNRLDDSQTCAVLTLPDFDFQVFDLATGDEYPLEMTII